MKIISTFEIVEDSLLSVQYEGEKTNEFRRLFGLWNDPEYLFDFFSENFADLGNEFWNGITIEEAIDKTRIQAKKLESKIYELALTGKMSNNNLSEYFEPLYKAETGKKLERDKGKGLEKGNWLRLYAIRIDKNFFVISGGAIKLTKKMEIRTHTAKELEKLDITRKYCDDSEDENIEYYTSI